MSQFKDKSILKSNEVPEEMFTCISRLTDTNSEMKTVISKEKNEEKSLVKTENKVNRIRLFLNYHVKELPIMDHSIAERNSEMMKTVMRYKTSYREVTRFLIGSWLLFAEKLIPPFNMKAIIIIETDQELVDVADFEGIEILLGNNIQSCLDSFYMRFYKEDLILYNTANELLLLIDNFKIPKYFAKLDMNQVRLKKIIEKKYMSLIKAGKL